MASAPNTEPEFIEVHHGCELPVGTVKAMHRGLNNTDPTCVDSYVSLCTYNGEECFGRSYLKYGHLVGSFPWGNKERITPTHVNSFKILVEKGPSGTTKCSKYKWRPLRDVIDDNSKYKAVQVPSTDNIYGMYGACVVSDVRTKDGRYLGEMLGKLSLSHEFAWTSYEGQELIHRGQQYYNCYVLCTKRAEYRPKCSDRNSHHVHVTVNCCHNQLPLHGRAASFGHFRLCLASNF